MCKHRATTEDRGILVSIHLPNDYTYTLFDVWVYHTVGRGISLHPVHSWSLVVVLPAEKLFLAMRALPLIFLAENVITLFTGAWPEDNADWRLGGCAGWEW